MSTRDQSTFDLAILGGGPAGVAAGVYAARKQLKTILLAREIGGQSTVSPDIQNWIGTPHISGKALADAFRAHLATYADGVLTVREGADIVSVHDDGSSFTITTSNENIMSQMLLIALGARRRRLQAKGADVFEHKGLTYCASCDGPLFTGKPVAVIGGGNAGFESAAQLAAYTPSVTILEWGDTFHADPVTVSRVLAQPHVRAITNAEVVEVFGDTFVRGLRWRERTTGTLHELPVEGIFVEIGSEPNTDLVASLVERDDRGRIVIDPWTGRTSHPRIWAAGDCTNVRYLQNNIAAGDGVKALEDIYRTFSTQ